MKNNTTPPIMHPAVYLTNAELHRVMNEPIDEPDPPRQPSDGRIWVAAMLISAVVFGKFALWVYHLIFG